MPHANIWIRKDDWETWNKLSNKSEWLHQHLGADANNPHFIGFDGEIHKLDKTKAVTGFSDGKDQGKFVGANSVTVHEFSPEQREVLMSEEKVPIDEGLKKLQEVGLLPKPQKVKGDRCPHGFNLKISKCKFGCKK